MGVDGGRGEPEYRIQVTSAKQLQVRDGAKEIMLESDYLVIAWSNGHGVSGTQIRTGHNKLLFNLMHWVIVEDNYSCIQEASQTSRHIFQKTVMLWTPLVVCIQYTGQSVLSLFCPITILCHTGHYYEANIDGKETVAMISFGKSFQGLGNPTAEACSITRSRPWTYKKRDRWGYLLGLEGTWAKKRSDIWL